MPIEGGFARGIGGGGATLFETVAVLDWALLTVAVDATAAVAPAVTGAAVGTISMGVNRITPPHAGQRAFFPAEPAGAFSFLPHEQRTVIVPSPAIKHPLSRLTKQNWLKMPRGCYQN
jgi:hypothetical protein